MKPETLTMVLLGAVLLATPMAYACSTTHEASDCKRETCTKEDGQGGQGIGHCEWKSSLDLCDCVI